MKRFIIRMLFLVVIMSAHCLAMAESFDGRCPVCKAKGLKSVVYSGMCMTTLMNTYSYYDENGYYHYEDPNTTTCDYHCSNGHTFVTVNGELKYDPDQPEAKEPEISDLTNGDVTWSVESVDSILIFDEELDTDIDIQGRESE